MTKTRQQLTDEDTLTAIKEDAKIERVCNYIIKSLKTGQSVTFAPGTDEAEVIVDALMDYVG